MPKIQAPRRIRTEDFSAEQRKLIERISESVNTFNEDVYNLLNNGLDFDNLNEQKLTVDIVTDGAGQISNEPKFVSSLRGRVSGVQVVNAENLNNPTTYPISQPFISYAQNGSIVTILNVTGLQSSSTYRLTIITIP